MNNSLLVAIVTYRNSKSEIMRCLSSVNQSVSMCRSVTARVVIGDSSPMNCLTEVDVEEIRETFDAISFEYKFFNANLQHSGGTNTLCQEAEESRILMLNPDTVVARDCIANLLVAHSPGYIIEARQFPFELTKPFMIDDGACSWVSGACLLIATTDFQKLGGFDVSRFPSYCNDVDLCWRGYSKGIESRVATTAFVYHNKLFDTEAMTVRQGAGESLESKISYLLMADRYQKSQVDMALRWLRRNVPQQVEMIMDSFESRRKAGSSDVTMLQGFDLFSVAGGFFGPTSPLQLHFALRAFRSRSAAIKSAEEPQK